MSKLETIPQILHEIESLNGYLIAAQDIVKLGHMPELKGLEVRIGALCEAIQKSEVETQRDTLPLLKVLLEQLNSCDSVMRATNGMPPAGQAS